MKKPIYRVLIFIIYCRFIPNERLFEFIKLLTPLRIRLSVGLPVRPLRMRERSMLSNHPRSFKLYHSFLSPLIGMVMAIISVWFINSFKRIGPSYFSSAVILAVLVFLYNTLELDPEK